MSTTAAPHPPDDIHPTEYHGSLKVLVQYKMSTHPKASIIRDSAKFSNFNLFSFLLPNDFDKMGIPPADWVNRVDLDKGLIMCGWLRTGRSDVCDCLFFSLVESVLGVMRDCIPFVQGAHGGEHP